MKTLIKAGAELIGKGLVPCLKAQVYAMLVTVDGSVFFGGNWMTNGEVTVCPRANCRTGEGYELCKEVCNQDFHAEVFCLKLAEAAGANVKGATMFVTGHVVCCDNCLAAMKAAGLASAEVVDSHKVYHF